MIRTYVYDPNNVNPYGRELTGLLNRSQFRTQLISSVSPGANRISRFLVSLMCAVRILTLPTGSAVVAVWHKNIIDTSALLVHARLKGPLFVVRHNPIVTRPSTRAPRWLTVALLRRATAVYHSELMASQEFLRPRRKAVAVHPPYAQLRAAASYLSVGLRARPTVALLGVLRPDKGRIILDSILHNLPSGTSVLVIGPDRLDPEGTSILETRDIIVEYAGEAGQFVDEQSLLAALKGADLLLAPYTEVTASGSVTLAFSLGLPTLGLLSDGLSLLLSERSMGADPLDLAQLIGDFLQNPWETYRVDYEDYTNSARLQWRAILGEADAPR